MVGDPTVMDVHSYKYSPNSNGKKAFLKFTLTFMNEEYKNIPLPRHFKKKQLGTHGNLTAKDWKFQNQSSSTFKNWRLSWTKSIIGFMTSSHINIFNDWSSECV